MPDPIPFDQYKIFGADYVGRDIAGLPNRPAFSAQQLKERFDALSKYVIREKHNQLCDYLNARSHDWRPIEVSTVDLTPGVSALHDGVVYLVYE